MATYNNNLMVYNAGQLVRVSANDTLNIKNLAITDGSTAGSVVVGDVTVSNTGVVSTGSLTLQGTSLVLNGAAEFDSTVHVSSDLSVDGNLTVEGDITSRSQVNVTIADSYLDLNFGNVDTTTARPAGFTFNLKAVTGSSHSLTAFVAGVSGTSAPAFKVTGNHTADYADGTIIQISGSANGANDGLYACKSDSYDAGNDETTVVIYGVGGTAVPGYALFIQNQFASAIGETATAVRVDLAVFGVSDGNHIKKSDGSSIGVGSLISAYYADAELADFNGAAGQGWSMVGAGSTGLQTAYDTTATITLTGSRDFNIDAPATGTAAVTIDSNANSNFTVAGADLTLATTTSGTLNVHSAGILDLQGTSLDADFSGAASIDATGAIDINSSGGAISIGDAANNYNINVGTAGTRTVAVGSASATLDLDGSSATLDTTGSFSIDGAGNSNVTVTNADLTLSTATSGNLDITSAGVLDLNAGANLTVDVTGTADINATGALNIDSSGGAIGIGTDADAHNISVGTGAAARIITIGNATGATEVQIDTGSGGLDVNASGAVTVDATANSNFTVASADLTLATTTSGTLNVHSAGALDLQGTSLAADFSGAVGIESSGGAIGIGTGSNNYALNLGTGGTRAISIGHASATSASVDGGAGALTLGGSHVKVTDDLILGKAGGYEQTTLANIAAGTLLFVDTDGIAKAADSNGTGTLEVEMVALETVGGSNASIKVASVHGSVVYVKFISSAPTAGQIAYLSDEVGLAKGFAASSGPTTGRVFRIGKVLSGTAVNTLYPVLFMPQYVADLT
jgi:hypothetical protein